MTIVFAAAISHAPGITAWPDAADAGQKARLDAGFARLQAGLRAARPEAMLVFTSEHWANFFLDHVSAFCVGRAAHFSGPVEPWLRIPRTDIPGDPALATALLEAAYAQGLTPGFAEELVFDHGTSLPLHFIAPGNDIPVVPIFINTLAPPLPSPQACAALGRVAGEVARASPKRIAIIATGGMSHDPGERNHGIIDSAFDHDFLTRMQAGDLAGLSALGCADLARAGAGALELLAWVALAAALGEFSGEIVAYEPVVPWATGIGLMQLTPLSSAEAAC